jgi:hypothetical protein
MNIFALDLDPVKAANYHCDQHVNKMILESAQLLSTAAFYLLPIRTYHLIKPVVYKPSYPNHPCALWLRSPESNPLPKLHYVRTLARQLNYIREYEWNQSEHSSIPVVETAYTFLSDYLGHGMSLPSHSALTENSFPRAMPAILKYNESTNSVNAYRRYYRLKHEQWALHGRGQTKGGMTYRNRPIPEFLDPDYLIG